MRIAPRRPQRLVALLLAAAAVSLALSVDASGAATARTAVADAYYAPGPAAPQSQGLDAFRQFLSSEQTSFDLQSYPFFGSLVDDRGRTNTFSLMMQQNNHVDCLPLSYALEGVMFNQGSGFTAGGAKAYRT